VNQSLAAAIVLMTAIVSLAVMTIVRMVFKKDERVAEIQARARAGSDPALKEAIEGLKKEVAQLRDTTTQYDMSFDSALQRLETRMSHLEKRTKVSPAAEEAAQQATQGR
jgi:hypothetical protein